MLFFRGNCFLAVNFFDSLLWKMANETLSLKRADKGNLKILNRLLLKFEVPLFPSTHFTFQHNCTFKEERVIFRSARVD